MGKHFNNVKSVSKKILGNYSVTREVNSETRDGATGQKTDSFASAATLDCAFFKQADTVGREIEGALETGDGVLVLPLSDTSTARDDKITVTYKDSTTEKFIVKHVEPPYHNDSKMAILEFLE